MDVQKSKIAVRARAIGMLEAGSTRKEVGKRLDVHINMVFRWWRRYNDEGIAGGPTNCSKGKRKQST